MRKIYTIGGDCGYRSWMAGVNAKTMEEADLVLVTGGEDIAPWRYGKKAHPTTSFNDQRDEFEFGEFKRAMGMGKKLLGVCRGSQALAVAAGGLLVQHSRHPSSHKITTYDGKEVTVTSSHHQQMWPWKLPDTDYKVLGWCNLSPFRWGENNQDDLSILEDEDVNNLKECEEVYFPRINALGLQHHPEYSTPPTQKWEIDYIAHCRSLLDRFLTNSL